MKLLFTGDLTFPSADYKLLDNVAHIFKGKVSIGNLEGPITKASEKNVIDKYKYNLYSETSVLDVINKLNYKYFSLANNHIPDYKEGFKSTVQLLKENGICYFGTKKKKFCIIPDKSRNIYIYGTATHTTGGNYTRNAPISRFKPNVLLKQIRNLRHKDKNALIVIFIHWGFELAYYPQPADRNWARNAIDYGANLVIGHHPHVIQGIEEYHKGIIAYSLGNFYLPQTTYLNKKLQYQTARVLEELLFEYDTEAESVVLHWLKYNKNSHQLQYLKETDLYTEDIEKLTPFRNYSNAEYLKWFRSKKKDISLENNTSRLPTYVKYRKGLNLEYHLKNYYFRFYQLVRKIFIKVGIHKPYNW